jgi:hypothetical protein
MVTGFPNVSVIAKVRLTGELEAMRIRLAGELALRAVFIAVVGRKMMLALVRMGTSLTVRFTSFVPAVLQMK